MVLVFGRGIDCLTWGLYLGGWAGFVIWAKGWVFVCLVLDLGNNKGPVWFWY